MFLPLWFLVRLNDLVLILDGITLVKLTLTHMVWTLVTGAIAMIAGTWVYHEE